MKRVRLLVTYFLDGDPHKMVYLMQGTYYYMRENQMIPIRKENIPRLKKGLYSPLEVTS